MNRLHGLGLATKYIRLWFSVNSLQVFVGLWQSVLSWFRGRIEVGGALIVAGSMQ